MSTFRRLFSSSVGTKLLLGLTGLALFAYLVLHLAGNVLIFAGPEVFNEYSHALISNPLILPIEVGLLAIFLLHVYKAVTNYAANASARPARYVMKKYAGHTSRKSVASSTMIWSGLVIFLFVLVHVKQFKYGAWYQVNNSDVRDLARLEFEVFAQPVWVVFSGDVPIAQHPDTGVPLAELVAHANLDRRLGPEDFPTARERAAATRRRATAKLPHPRRRRSDPDADAELVSEGVGELDELRPAERRAPKAGQPKGGDEPGS